MSKRTEETVVEIPFVETCVQVGYVHLNGLTLSPDFNSKERLTFKDVILNDTFKNSLKKLNPSIIDAQVSEIVQLLKVQRPSVFEANKEIYNYLTKGIKLTTDTKTGKKDQTFRLISEDHSENIYHVVNQFKIQGLTENIRPDIILFINGLPITLVECKYSGTEASPLTAGFDQIKVYERKVPQLFYFNQILISTYKDKAQFGSITGIPNSLYEWKETYPFNKQGLNSQDTMIWGLLHPENITDILFNHIGFEDSAKLLPRYQQFRAVKKTISLISEEKAPRIERGGLVFHTQRSGKTFTMINLAKALHKQLPDYKIVFLVDRTDLEVQHLKSFKKTLEYPVVEIDDSQELQKELKTNSSNIVFGMIHKFRDDEKYEELNASHKIIVIVDEAHRSQYKSLGANLNRALPNAPKIGFTGTPLFKNDTSVKEFGKIIDSYTRSEAVADKCTVPLKYESRLPVIEAEIKKIESDESLMLGKVDKKLKDKAIRRFVNVSNIFNSQPVIAVIAKDIINHYTTVVEPEGFKAMIVVEDKATSIEYLKMIKLYSSLNATIIVSGDHNDPPEMKPYTDSVIHESQIEEFKDKNGKLKILIVVAKLLTGFNAPICQVLYFCKKLKEHSLAQAIDRPITPYPNKQYGLIVDYVGIRESLEETIKMFDDPSHQKDIYQDIKNDFETIKEKHKEFLKYAYEIDLSKDYSDQFLIFESQEKRDSLMDSYRDFNKAINILLPDPEAVKYAMIAKKYLKFIKELRGFYLDESMGLSEIGEKIKILLNDHIKVDDITSLEEPIDVLSVEFLTQVKSRSKVEVQKAEVLYAIKKYVKTNRNHDPVYFDKVSKKVEEVLSLFNGNSAEHLKELLKLREEIKSQESYAKSINLEFKDLPKLHTIQEFVNNNSDLSINDKSSVAINLLPVLEEAMSLIQGYKNKIDGLDKPENIQKIKSQISEMMSDAFFKEDNSKADYSLFMDRAELLAIDLVDKYR